MSTASAAQANKAAALSGSGIVAGRDVYANQTAPALMAAAILLAISHVRASRGKALPAPASAIIAVFVVVAAVATSVQVYRIGHSGAESVWGDALTSSPAGESED